MCIAVAVLIIVDYTNRRKPVAKLVNSTVWVKYAVYLIILLAIFLFGYYGPGFDPQDFVYFQF
jgi:hypothetical protein